MKNHEHKNNQDNFPDIDQQFYEALSSEGLGGARDIVDNLEAEYEASQQMIRVVDDLESGEMAVPLDEADNVAEVLDGIVRDHDLAERRLKFARSLYATAQELATLEDSSLL